jgi:DNA-binding response OmpR family regulator
MMPELSGFDVAAVLKNDPLTRQIPIIILSVVHDRERGYLIGVDRYLTKPVEMSELLDEVESLLQPRSGSRTVLVVEEDAATRNRLQEILEGQGWVVMTAATAADGLEQATAARPEIVIANAGLAERYQLSRVLRVERGLKDLSFLLIH